MTTKEALPRADQRLALPSGAWKVLRHAQATGTTNAGSHGANFVTMCVRNGLAVREDDGVIRLTERGQRLADYLLR